MWGPEAPAHVLWIFYSLRFLLRLIVSGFTEGIVLCQDVFCSSAFVVRVVPN